MVPSGSDEGNTKSRRPAPAKCWIFTWFMEEAEADGSIGSIVNDKRVKKWVIGKEHCPTTGMFHLQGWLYFKTKCRPKGFWDDSIHWQKQSRKATIADNFEYCTKENDYIQNLYEEIEDDLKGLDLFPWQEEIMDIINKKPDPRKIYWFWETVGNVGKSEFARHVCLNNPRAISVSGTPSDIKYAFLDLKKKDKDIPKIVFWDIPRTRHEFLSFEAIESIKNGMFFSTKYESGMLIYNKPHIIIFSNYPPPIGEEKLSKDRWEVRKIENKFQKSIPGKVN